jgi:hypothetical protein
MSEVVEIPVDRLERYRSLIAPIEMSDKQKDEVILLVNDIIRSFVDQAFGLDSPHISLKGRLTDSFRSASCHAIVVPPPHNDLQEPAP